MPISRITIKDLARRAGVSVASVSRALNGQPGVGATTRRRIEELARALGYAPDSRAQALVTGQVPFVGLVVPDIANPFYPEVARGAEEALLERGHSLLLVNTDWQPGRLEQALGLLTSRHVAGLLVSVPLNGVLRRSDWAQLQSSMVAVGQEVPRARGRLLPPLVDVDDRYGASMVGHHLAGLGWRRIAFLAGPERDRTARARLEGFRRGLERAGAGGALREVRHGDWTVHSGYEEGRALLSGIRTPDAIFAANDLIALGVARAAAELGRRLGHDLGLVGYDDIEPVRYLEVPITSVAQPKRQLGQQAAQILLARLAGEPSPNRRVRLRPKLVIRSSCGADRR
jgi:LacI family transcriptional regulator